MVSTQVCLRLDKFCPEIHRGIVVFQLGPPFSTVFLELPRLHDKAINYLCELSLGDGLYCCCGLVNALFEPCIKALKIIGRVVWILKFGVVFRKICGRDPCIVAGEVSDELKHQDCRVPVNL